MNLKKWDDLQGKKTKAQPFPWDVIGRHNKSSLRGRERVILHRAFQD